MSEKAKHTPAPWEWEDTQTLWGGGNPQEIVMQATDDGEPHGLHSGVIAHHLDPATAVANRALIEAAPELLEALDLAKRYVECYESTSLGAIDDKQVTLLKINSAIKKAKPAH
jgi:hypothetical protein